MDFYNIYCKEELIYSQIDRDEMFEIVDELSQQYYETGLPNPEDLVVECVSIDEE